MKLLDRPEAIHILAKYIKTDVLKLKWYSDVAPYIKAIVFYGSTAKELNKPESDLDILIFVPLEVENKYTKGEYSDEFEGREINIVFRSIERLRKISEDHNHSFETEIFRDCEILYESDSEVRKLILKISGQ